MSLAEWKTVVELGGLGLFALMIYREQVKMRETLHGLRSDFMVFFTRISNRDGGSK